MSYQPFALDSIRQISPTGQEYWSARDLMPLLGYTSWPRFEGAIKRSIISCQQIGAKVEVYFQQVFKEIEDKKGRPRQVRDYLLSREGCYLLVQNGDPRKPEIAAVQAYIAIETIKYELLQTKNKPKQGQPANAKNTQPDPPLTTPTETGGVLSASFGQIHLAGYEGLYGGMGAEEIKAYKDVPAEEDLDEVMNRAEWAMRQFYASQTEQRLQREGVIDQAKALEIQQQVGETVRETVKALGTPLPEDLPVYRTSSAKKKPRRKKQFSRYTRTRQLGTRLAPTEKPDPE
jgi:DNA-damage-inducible protein D